jgi:hypothetical protein
VVAEEPETETSMPTWVVHPGSFATPVIFVVVLGSIARSIESAVATSRQASFGPAIVRSV